ncbi:MAG: hypothetical protein EZS26_003766 [Candidatus Ordinivivax streblomastigis]|uniref:DUF3575 domain-containing protein n=1 Tax=Candidatus Ordinivivax streblomastigis TaxID=2540710 RepID=A0A5M8NTA7_9BACT|nr:MAG: hypothetical protein EZS26_003766 [Candidatus Ordinivivax streblomastigis]
MFHSMKNTGNLIIINGKTGITSGFFLKKEYPYLRTIRMRKSERVNKLLKTSFFLCLFFVIPSLHAQTSVPVEKLDTFCYSLFFHHNRSEIDYKLSTNAGMMHRMDSVIRFHHKYHHISSIDILAYTSFEGTWESNIKLSENRASAIKNYLLDTFQFLEQVHLHAEGLGEDWNLFREKAISDGNIPFRKQLIEIIDNPHLNYDQKELGIKRLDRGATYRYLLKNIMLSQRRVDVHVILHYEKEAVLPRIVPPVTVGEPKPRPEPLRKPTAPKFWAVKTNLLQWGAGVSNIGVEYPVAGRFSIDFPVVYSPYTIRNNWKIRTLGIQPEFRWWGNRQMIGHFLGLHAHLAYYNMATDELDRYQDKDGKTPLWGAGLSYGYVLPLRGRWNMEFTAGAGYARLVYDVFYNVSNGTAYDTRSKNYWGLTRAGVTLVYKLNK